MGPHGRSLEAPTLRPGPCSRRVGSLPPHTGFRVVTRCTEAFGVSVRAPFPAEPGPPAGGPNAAALGGAGVPRASLPSVGDIAPGPRERRAGMC